jgi:hypothetical protein
MQFSRADFYEKELSFQVSCSYGPGRYDSEYEEKGHDYPVGYVRWTEQRNFEAVLDLMADGRLDMKPLISHRYEISDASDAYDTLTQENPLGVLLEYEFNAAEAESAAIRHVTSPNVEGAKAVVAFVGAGAYASGVLVNAFSRTNARLKAISSATGVSAVHVAKKFSIEQAATDSQALLQDLDVNALVIATRHNSHAGWVMDGLRHGKHVFVEKPLVLTREELGDLTAVYNSLEEKPILMVGFNRRYSPHVTKMKTLVAAKKQPMSLLMTVNAGMIPADHWTQDRSIGGGRIIGECCHFIDLLRYLTGHSITSISSQAMESECKDSVLIQLGFADG